MYYLINIDSELSVAQQGGVGHGEHAHAHGMLLGVVGKFEGVHVGGVGLVGVDKLLHGDSPFQGLVGVWGSLPPPDWTVDGVDVEVHAAAASLFLMRMVSTSEPGLVQAATCSAVRKALAALASKRSGVV